MLGLLGIDIAAALGFALAIIGFAVAGAELQERIVTMHVFHRRSDLFAAGHRGLGEHGDPFRRGGNIARLPGGGTGNRYGGSNVGAQSV